MTFHFGSATVRQLTNLSSKLVLAGSVVSHFPPYIENKKE